MPRKIYEELVIPTEAITTVLDWVKAEQIRVIQKDRTLGFNKIQKLDWLTETIDNLEILQERAEDDNSGIRGHNATAERMNAIEEKEAAKNCSCQPVCTCRKPLPPVW